MSAVYREGELKFEFHAPHSVGQWPSHSFTGIYALHAALGLLLEVGMDAVSARIRELLVHSDTELRALGCDTGPSPEHRAGILTFLPPRGEAVALARHLSAHQVSFSLRRGRIRISPHFYNQPAEVDRLVALVRDFTGGRG